ncbi:PREDICTED: uncharacterized protein LOC109340097 [Lupinus angustifolius]|uniref:uncharacterized protein LOC109340097 n=1 Tax=Lupinus angustifolius TaxID=3871 RepID=UPI00092E4E7F|nr:PREDICTED: uncharacterized protein LOC109340097 [Lupinus angustifolius]
MTNNGGFLLTLPVLDGMNYDCWRNQMKAIFGFQEVFEVVQHGYQEIEEGAVEAQRINGAETAKHAWDSLEKSYEGMAKIKKVKLQQLRRQYELLQMEESDSVAEYMTKILTLTIKMRSCGKVLKEKSIVEKVLRTLTCKYDHIVVAIEESKNLEELKIEELQASLESHELRLKERNLERIGDQELQARFTKKPHSQWSKKGNSKWRTSEQGLSGIKTDIQWKSGKEGDSKESTKNAYGRRKFDRKKLQCYKCRNYGHFASECKMNRWTGSRE